MKAGGCWSEGSGRGLRLEGSALLPLLYRGLLHSLLHLLLHLRHSAVLLGGGAGPVYQPRERHCLEEDLPPLTGHWSGICGH